MMKIVFPRIAALIVLCSAPAFAGSATISVDAAKHGPAINPRLYGVFLEEINTAVDGGLYAELIRNRGFEDAKPPEGFASTTNRPRNNVRPPTPGEPVWVNPGGYATKFFFEADKSLPYWSLVKDGTAQGSMTLDLEHPLNPATPRSCRLEIEDASGRIGIANEGFWGINVVEGDKYELSFWARGEGFNGPLAASLETTEGGALSGTAKISGITSEWKQFKATLTGSKSSPQARFVLAAGAKGKVWLDLVSLFPQKTFKNRPNGLRPDIAQLIADLKPGFVRFPGGCVSEGATIESAYNWKKSVGPLEQREEIWNVWDYRRTHGMGMYEYLQFCEDIAAEPLFVSFAGQTCIYRNGTNLPMDNMQWVLDGFLDALEYANGPATSKWGAMRAAAGHPTPFNMKMLEIGNENTGRAYQNQYSFIYPKVKAAYPDVLALACFPQPNSPTEMADEHYYSNPLFFINGYHRYDKTDRKTPPIYIAEVAVTSGEGGRDKGNLVSALSEGVFLMGCERNADHVQMVSYAPLLGNVHGRNDLAGAPPPWHGMIYFDSSRAYGTVSYYLWKTFAENRPETTWQTDVRFPGDENFKVAGQIGLGTWDTSAEFKDVKVEKGGQSLLASDFAQNAEGWQSGGRGARGGGQWSVVDGAYRQAQPGRATSYAGAEDWSDYTLSLKARKLGGGEGFLIVFGRKANDMYWWNLGGWGNSQHGLEQSAQGSQMAIGAPVPGRIETNRWYDIKVELSGSRVRCYLDGKLIHDETAEPAVNFFAVAGPEAGSGDVLLKVINTSSQPYTTELNINGVTKLASTAQVTLLTGPAGGGGRGAGRGGDYATPSTDPSNNSLDNPKRIVPSVSSSGVSGSKFSHDFPANSLTVFRIKTR
jgi:alpha-L-arabinofuranosidase